MGARSTCLLVVLSLAAASDACGVTLRVPTQWPNVQSAITAAAPGDTVALDNGVYSGPGNRDIEFLGKAIVVRSSSGEASACVIVCDGSVDTPHRGFRFGAGEPAQAVLEGIAIRGGWDLKSGSGILVEATPGGQPSAPTIRGCVIESCASPEGAAVHVLRSTMTLEQCVVRGNPGRGVLMERPLSATLRQVVVEENGGDGLYIDVGAATDARIRIEDSRIAKNGGHGLRVSPEYSDLSCERVDFEDNGGWGLFMSTAEGSDLDLLKCGFRRNGAGGARIGGGTRTALEGCRFDDNLGDGLSFNFAFGLDATGGGASRNAGHGIRLADWGLQTPRPADTGVADMRGMDLSGNALAGLLIAGCTFGFGVQGCTIAGNGWAGVDCAVPACIPGFSAQIVATTVTGNHGPGIRWATDLPCDIERTLVAFNAGPALESEPAAAVPVLACSDLYGNAGGDWEGAVAPQLALRDNFSSNPLFCAAGTADLKVASDSPCLPGGQPGLAPCGVVGAVTQGCSSAAVAPARVVLSPSGVARIRRGATQALTVQLLDGDDHAIRDVGSSPTLAGGGNAGALGPLRLAFGGELTWQATYVAGAAAGVDTIVAADPEAARPADTLRVEITDRAIITHVRDVRGDQGRQVRVGWLADVFDTPDSTTPVTEYVVWRRIDDRKPGVGRPVGQAPSLVAAAGGDWLLESSGARWEPVGPRVPAMTWDSYAAVVPTLADSTSDGLRWSVFFVTAHTLDPHVWFASAPDSGWSVDNLAPNVPEGVQIAYAAAGASLAWLPSGEVDFRYFRIRRALDGEGAYEPVAATVGSEWQDPLPGPSAWHWKYAVSAVDFAGNESPWAFPSLTTAVGGGGAFAASPRVCASPNPANPRAVVTYEVPPGGGEVLLSIHDGRGRRIRTLVAGFVPEGEQAAVWDGRDDMGRPVASGTYLLRLRAGDTVARSRLALVR